MKVYDQNLTGTALPESAHTQETQRAHHSRGSNQNSSAAGGGSDRVELSSALGSLSRALTTYGSDRTNQVQQLTAQYQSGSYSSDPNAISRGMIAEAVRA